MFETHIFKINIFCEQNALFKFMKKKMEKLVFSVHRFMIKMGAKVGKEIFLFLEFYFSVMNILEVLSKKGLSSIFN